MTAPVELSAADVRPPPRPRTRVFWMLCKIMVAAGVLGFLFSRIDGAQLRQMLSRVHLGFWLGAIAWLGAMSVLDAVAMRRLLLALGAPLKLLEIVRVNYQTYFFAFLGAVPGGLARWTGLAGPGRKLQEALAAILMERYLRLAAVVALGLASFAAQPVGRFAPLEYRVWLAGWAAVGAAALIFGGLIFTRRGAALARRLPVAGRRFAQRRLPRFVSVLAGLPDRRGAWAAAGAGFVARAALNAVTLMLLLRAVGERLPPGDALWVVSCMTLAQTVPITVYGLGIREGVLVYLLAKFGLAAEAGLGAGLLWFWASACLGLAGGAWFLGGRRAESCRGASGAA